MSGQSLNGYGFTIGGSGDSWLNPNTVMANDMTGGYYSGSLTDRMIIKCDTLYARHAEIDTLDAKIVNVNGTLNTKITNVSDTLNAYTGRFNTIETKVLNLPSLSVRDGIISIGGYRMTLADPRFWYIEINGERYNLEGPYVYGSQD